MRKYVDLFLSSILSEIQNGAKEGLMKEWTVQETGESWELSAKKYRGLRKMMYRLNSLFLRLSHMNRSLGRVEKKS